MHNMENADGSTGISIHALLAESDGMNPFEIEMAFISIHALLAESDSRPGTQGCQRPISIHALLAESDFRRFVTSAAMSGFLSTLSLRRATPMRRCKGNPQWYFYPRSPCGERPMASIYFHGIFYFYPRSPCGERPFLGYHYTFVLFISIHALLAESDRFG